jgi:hypothetical protein
MLAIIDRGNPAEVLRRARGGMKKCEEVGILVNPTPPRYNSPISQVCCH